MDLRVVTSVDPRLAEACLMAQPDVLDASVWFQGSRLVAFVTLQPDAHTDEQTIRSVCVAAIGERQAPDEITLARTALVAA
ncbi:MAG: hypothetical protein U0S12_06860 [Fimbriimonadales bacterium]